MTGHVDFTPWPRPPTIDFWRLDPLDAAGGWIPGTSGHWAPWFGPEPSDRDPALPPMSPVAALEHVIRPCLVDEPCAVMFSGGRDSSLILAVALRLARREGLPSPIAITRSFPKHPAVDESEWQELVVRHLGVRDWLRLDQDLDCEILSPSIQESLTRHGILWPPMTHSLAAVLKTVAGGTILTGEGGDEWFGRHRSTPIASFQSRIGRRNPSLYRMAFEQSLPRVVRRRQMKALLHDECLWMRPEPRSAFLAKVVDDQTFAPFLWRPALERLGRRLTVHVSSTNLAALASSWDVAWVNPIQSRLFTSALQQAGGAWGFPGRSSLMTQLFHDLLPEKVLRRSTKAFLDEVMWGETSAEFVRRWGGGGVDTRLIDSDELRREWATETPDSRTVMLLHSAWLDEAGTPSSSAPDPPSQRADD